MPILQFLRSQAAKWALPGSWALTTCNRTGETKQRLKEGKNEEKKKIKNHTLFAINALQDTTLKGGTVHR